MCDKNCPLRQYFDNNAISDQLHALAAEQPGLAAVFVLGRSVSGEKMTGLRVTAGAGRPRTLLRPTLALIGNMHGEALLQSVM